MRMIGKKTYQEAAKVCVLPSPHQHIVQVVAAKGNNRYEVRDAQDRCYLVTMPGKFRKTLWIFPGHYVLVNPLQETGRSVRGEIAHILLPEHIDFIQQHRLWPEEFNRREVKGRNTDYLDDILLPTSDLEDDEDVADLMYNFNKVFITDDDNDTRPSVDDYEGDDDDDDENENKSSDGDDDDDDDETESSDTGDEDDSDTKPSDSGLDSDDVDSDETNLSHDDCDGNDDETSSSHGYYDGDDNDDTRPSDDDYDGDEEEELQQKE